MNGHSDAAPVIWALLGDKGGDNAQVTAVCERLPWPVEIKHLSFKRFFRRGKPFFLPSLYHVDRPRSDALEPPWPDVVLTIGRRPAMAATWIRDRSGGRTRVVLFGRPRSDAKRFALIVAATQFHVPSAANVVHTTLPLMRIDHGRIASARTEWQSSLAGLPRPLIAVLVGGATRPYTFDAGAARSLLLAAQRYAGDGTLYVTTSRRTNKTASAALRDALPSGAHIWQWGDPSPNPYLGLLAHADGFVVTGDSMSMITEVVRLGRPLAVFPLPLRALTRWARSHLPEWLAYLPTRAIYQWLPKFGVTVFRRDLSSVYRRLVEHGHAALTPDPLPTTATPLDDDLDRVVNAVRNVVVSPA